ncbi:unnamed protein product [Urochloa humidicola]
MEVDGDSGSGSAGKAPPSGVTAQPGRQTSAKAMAAAAIQEAVISPTRSSPRLAGNAEEHAMEKAQKRAAARALELPEGNLQGDLLE